MQVVYRMSITIPACKTKAGFDMIRRYIVHDRAGMTNVASWAKGEGYGVDYSIDHVLHDDMIIAELKQVNTEY